MIRLYPFAVMALIVATMSSLLSSCGSGVQSAPTTSSSDAPPSKATQCAKLVDSINKTQTPVEKAHSTNPQSLIDAATALEQTASEMQALTLPDEKLRDLQSQYVKHYQAVSEATKSTMAAVKAHNRSGVGKSLQSLQQATQQNAGLSEAVNRYCAN